MSLCVATPTAHVPIDCELYLPRDWTEDDARRAEARIPDEVKFKTKLELALDMIDRALADDLQPGMLLVDAAYGTSQPVSAQTAQKGLSYGVAVNSSTKVWQLDTLDRRRGGRTLTVAAYANLLVERGDFRRTTWREGTNGNLSARFAARRVLPICDQGLPRAEREVVWLLMEWENGDKAPNKFHFITAPTHVTKKWLVRQVKQRWRTERLYQDMKGQLGLDHFEGRRYPGWHHHISVVLSCYAFIVAEHARLFPPRSEARIEPVRTASRPERHFPDSFATARIAIAQVLALWLPRCPFCRRSCDCAPRSGGPAPPAPPLALATPWSWTNVPQ